MSTTANHRFDQVIPPLLSEITRAGRRATLLPETDVPPADLPSDLLRQTPPALPEVSEQDVVRHYTRLSHANMSIDTNFYPLGSCTMKYNPKVNEVAASIPGMRNLHPLNGEALSQGALKMLYDLQNILAEISGFAGVSLQPAAGAQGELAGILMIRAFHRSRGDMQRTRILVPDSAHGTNPATVSMAGFEAVEVPSDQDGNIDLGKLRELCGPDIAGLMVTNPNTLGLFEQSLPAVVDAIHECGGLVYGDGANLNALLGVLRPGDLGIDVMHFNLHKTFSTPHGGGGPGAGPVGATETLLPFLPGPIVTRAPDTASPRSDDNTHYQLSETEHTIGRLKAFHGNFGMLLRAYVYIRMHGASGMREIAENAVLNANYLKELVSTAFPSRYDRVCMHEFVSAGNRFDGISTMDIAKRLLDHGYHAPTVYFPLIVKDALMVEPTESENRETIEAFADALLAVAREAEEQPALLHDAPSTTPLGRLDEVKAVRDLRLSHRER